MKYTLSESSYTASCLMLSGIFRSMAAESRSAVSSGVVFLIFHRGCSSESGMASSSTTSFGCALGTGLLAVRVLSSCAVASAMLPISPSAGMTSSGLCPVMNDRADTIRDMGDLPPAGLLSFALSLLYMCGFLSFITVMYMFYFCLCPCRIREGLRSVGDINSLKEASVFNSRATVGSDNSLKFLRERSEVITPF